MATRYADLDPDLLRRAVRMARLPAVTRKRTAERFGISTGMLRRALDDHPSVSWTTADLVLHALTDAGTRREGTISDLRLLASYCDYVNKDGCTVEEVQRRLQLLVDQQRLSIDGDHWTLLVDFP